MKAKYLAGPLALSLALAPVPGWSAETIRCESNDRDMQHCRVDGMRERDVRLARELSRSPCIRGDTWGTDRHGIWVDKGCRADFRVSGGGRDRERSRDRDYDRDYSRERERERKDDDSGISTGTAVAVGIGILAVAAAIAASSSDEGGSTPAVDSEENREASQRIARSCDREANRWVDSRGGRYARLDQVREVRRAGSSDWVMRADYELVFEQNRSETRQATCRVDAQGFVSSFAFD